jgi:thiamine biosynthesis lipoprotein
MARIDVSDQAVATSGDYYQYFSRDLLHHHIIDPRVGYSAPELASVTIVSENTLASDALATAVTVLGTKEGLKLIESTPGVEGYLIKKNLTAVMSSGMQNDLVVHRL